EQKKRRLIALEATRRDAEQVFVHDGGQCEGEEDRPNGRSDGAAGLEDVFIEELLHRAIVTLPKIGRRPGRIGPVHIVARRPTQQAPYADGTAQPAEDRDVKRDDLDAVFDKERIGPPVDTEEHRQERYAGHEAEKPEGELLTVFLPRRA